VDARRHDVLANFAKKYVDVRFRTVANVISRDNLYDNVPRRLRTIRDQIDRMANTYAFPGASQDPRSQGRVALDWRDPGRLENWDWRIKQINTVSTHGADLEADLLLVEHQSIITQRHDSLRYGFFEQAFGVLYGGLEAKAARWLSKLAASHWAPCRVTDHDSGSTVDNARAHNQDSDTGQLLILTLNFINHVAAYYERNLDDLKRRIDAAPADRPVGQATPQAIKQDIRDERRNDVASIAPPWRELMNYINILCQFNTTVRTGALSLQTSTKDRLRERMENVYNVLKSFKS
jgi:hypothetical protein